MPPPGSERSVFGIGRMAVLATCPFPRVQPIVKPAPITEVLLEVIDSHDTHLSRQAVANLLDDVVLGSGYEAFYLLCIHGGNGVDGVNGVNGANGLGGYSGAWQYREPYRDSIQQSP